MLEKCLMKITIKFLTPELVPLLIKIVELSGKVVKKLINDVCGTIGTSGTVEQ